jgi:cardiolipin synthase
MRIGDPSFASTLVGYTGTPVVGGNRVEVLLNGDQIFPAKLETIRSARQTLNLAEYVFEEGEPAAQVADAIAERCRAGVRVNVLLDAVGSLGMPTEYRQRMVDAGCKVESYRPLRPFTMDRVNNRNHRRILVADGRVAMVGGSGTSGKWSGDGRQEGHWRDTDVRVEGPVVEQLQGAFVENWLEATGVALGGEAYFPSGIPARGPVSAQAVRSSPAGGSTSMYTMLLLAMASARRSILITNPYFLPEEKMTESLIRARRLGVRVVLLIPGVIDHALVRQASRGELGPLLQAGVEVYEYQDALLHAKTMVIDGHWSTVGSANLDPRSFGLSEELNLVMYDRAVAQRLEQAFEADLGHARRITYDAWRNRSFLSRVLELISAPIRPQL